jgi:hypothetical protein
VTGERHEIYLLDKVGRVIGWPSRSETIPSRKKGHWHVSRFYTPDACGPLNRASD